jgi:hypothetical protein
MDHSSESVRTRLLSKVASIQAGLQILELGAALAEDQRAALRDAIAGLFELAALIHEALPDARGRP